MPGITTEEAPPEVVENGRARGKATRVYMENKRDVDKKAGNNIIKVQHSNTKQERANL